MSDWENEDLEPNENNEGEKKLDFNEFDDESEVIPVEKKDPVEKPVVKEKETNIYEKKYQERKKKDIAIMKEIEESIKNIEDPELRLKKKIGTYGIETGRKIYGRRCRPTKRTKRRRNQFKFRVKNRKRLYQSRTEKRSQNKSGE